MPTTTLVLDAEESQLLAEVQARYGLPTLNAALRWALRPLVQRAQESPPPEVASPVFAPPAHVYRLVAEAKTLMEQMAAAAQDALHECQEELAETRRDLQELTSVCQDFAQKLSLFAK